MTLKGKIFTHPACACEDSVELVKQIALEFDQFEVKEVSLVTAEGRKEAFEVGVKTIPTLLIGDDILLVTSQEITKDNIISHINSH